MLEVVEVDGHGGQLNLRATENLRYDLVLGLDFGVERDIQTPCRERGWRCGDQGEWCHFVATREESGSKSQAINRKIINVLVGGYCDGVTCTCLLGASRTRTPVS